ncbi:unnamed protein product [Linum trigynum]|uniref:Uncharacterized protein n=1 Tax=Linum trigynum TaxID=586398 RepID=A0AAV2FD21_9ROSI
MEEGQGSGIKPGEEEGYQREMDDGAYSERRNADHEYRHYGTGRPMQPSDGNRYGYNNPLYDYDDELVIRAKPW